MKIMISPGNFSKMHKCVHERFEENSDLIVFNLGSSVNELHFLGATKHLYNWLCLLVGWLVGWSVTHLFDDPHVAPH